MNIVQIAPDVWQNNPTGLTNKWTRREKPIKYIVLHTTGGVDSRNWLAKWNKKALKSDQNNVSIHYLVQRDGTIYDIVPDDCRAWHVGVCKMPDGETDGNEYSIGIEIEHLNEPDYPEVQLNAVAELVHTLTKRHNIPSKFVVSHASVAKPGVGEPHGPRKIDPVRFDWGDFWSRVLRHDAPMNTLVSNLPTYSAYSPLINTTNINEQRVAEFIATKKNEFYDAPSLKLITSYYVKYGKQTGVDWVFALAQCIHETGWFTSWWCQRPRRNPAGIGVTGQTTKVKPADEQNWVFYQGLWRKGQSFTSWDLSAQHHISRLLCYALKDEEMSSTQLQFSKICGADKTTRIRGIAKQAIGLNGVWAVPGTTYAQRIASIANSIVSEAE